MVHALFILHISFVLIPLPYEYRSGAIIEYKNRCETCVDCPNCFASLQLTSDATASAARRISWSCDHCKVKPFAIAIATFGLQREC
jgi:hypothetical protein